MFRERIQERYEQLSPRFRALADFILENTLDAGFLTATELAHRVKVDPATVVRFSQELGYSGYRELSREIKRYVNTDLALRYQREAGKAEDKELVTYITHLADEASDRVLTLKADAELIAKVAELMHQASRIFITSKMEGYGLASLWATYLSLAGLKAYPLRAEVAKAALMLRDAQPGDLLLAISVGLDPDIEVSHLINAAHERGLHTVALTTSPTLIPARQAEVNLVTSSKTPAGYPSFDTLAVLLSIVWQAVLALDKEKADANIKAALTSLNALVAEQDKVPMYDIAALLRLWGQE